MAGFLKGGPAVAPEPEPTQSQADADEARAAAQAAAFGAAASNEYDTFMASLPGDAGPAAPLVQPANIGRFNAAVFSWRGGSNAVDNPVVRVERRVDGKWTPFADQSGEVPTFLHFPQGVAGVATTRAGMQEWKWSAAFEAYDAFPSTLPSVPTGEYRFVVEGVSRHGGKDVPYSLNSRAFTVRPWDGITVEDLKLDTSGSVSFVVPSIDYPRTYVPADPVIRFVQDDGNPLLCKTCAFRPWASTSTVASAVVTVRRASGAVEQVPATLSGGRWVASTALASGDRAFVAAGGVVDRNGEINGTPTPTVFGT